MSISGFVTVTGGASGTGNGTVNYTVAANGSVTPRNGSITIAGQTFTINQAGAAAPPTITTHPQGQTIAFGQTPALLTVAATGSGTLSYQWYRGVCGAANAPIGAATGSSYNAPALTSTSRYRASVSNAGGTTSSNSATITVAFTDDPLGSGLIRVAHILELRTRINALRACYGLGAYSYQDPTLEVGTTTIKAQHILDLRAALNGAHVAAGQPVPTYTDSALGAGFAILAIHVAELRAAVTVLE